MWVNSILDPQFTRGEAAGLAATATLGICSLCWLAFRKIHQRFPFKMDFSDQDYSSPPHIPRIYRSRLEASTEKKNITLRLRTKYATEISKVELRFVNKPFLFFQPQDTSTDAVKITKLILPEWDAEAEFTRDMVGPNSVTTMIDQHGGMIASVPRPKRWVIGEPLWIELEIEITKPWRGYLNFRGQTDRRARISRRVKFYEKK